VAVSDDGATVAFEATSRNPAESGQQVFVRTFANGNTELVSASQPGSRFATGNGTSSLQAGCLSSSGETVVFSSWSTDLVPSDTNRAMDVFVRDMIAGVTLLASANTKGQAGNGMSLEPFLSSDGLKVAFSSRANDLVPGDTNGAQDVFVRDLVSGRTELLSKTTAGFEAGNKDSRAPTISSDGRFFFFRSLADNLVAGASTPGKENLFIRDREGGVTTALTTNGLVGPIAITADGSHVAAVTDVYYPSLYVWVTATRRAIYRNTSKPFYALGLSDGGARLAWFGSGGTFSDLFMAETGTGKLKSIGRFAGATRPGLSFSSQGKHFVFAAASSVGTPTQVYMHDVLSGTNCLVTSSYLSGGPANGSSDMPVITSDGRFVAFRSEASDLVPFDSNTAPDVFLHDLLTSTTLLVSASQIGAARSGNHRSGMPQFNGTGNVLMFQTFASDLFDQDFNGAMDLVLCRMLQDSGADLLLELVSGSSEKRLITWPAVPGHKYRVEFADSLENGDWRLLPGIITMLGAQAIIEDASQVSGSRFYRVVKY
jgi:Tol biopolymer transport system component